MNTIKKIRESIDLQELKSSDEFGLSDNNLINSEFYMLIWKRIKNVCKNNYTEESRKGITLSQSYYFTFSNIELLNTLRQLYSNTKNSFVKKVIKTVGQNKRMTEKQIEIIIEEMIKFNLTLNF